MPSLSLPQKLNHNNCFLVSFSYVVCVRSQLEMEDGDEIDAMLHQTGGGGAII